MKKIIFISMFIIVILLLNNKQYNVSKDSIRFRVIANSNMPRDIIMKERKIEKEEYLNGILREKPELKSFIDNYGKK